jgi:hypothetical protein
MIRLVASTSILSGGMYLYNITMNSDSQTLVLIYDCMSLTLPANRFAAQRSESGAFWSAGAAGVGRSFAIILDLSMNLWIAIGLLSLLAFQKLDDPPQA